MFATCSFLTVVYHCLTKMYQSIDAWNTLTTRLTFPLHNYHTPHVGRKEFEPTEWSKQTTCGLLLWSCNLAEVVKWRRSECAGRWRRNKTKTKFPASPLQRICQRFPDMALQSEADLPPNLACLKVSRTISDDRRLKTFCCELTGNPCR